MSGISSKCFFTAWLTSAVNFRDECYWPFVARSGCWLFLKIGLLPELNFVLWKASISEITVKSSPKYFDLFLGWMHSCTFDSLSRLYENVGSQSVYFTNSWIKNILHIYILRNIGSICFVFVEHFRTLYFFLAKFFMIRLHGYVYVYLFT